MSKVDWENAPDWATSIARPDWSDSRVWLGDNEYRYIEGYSSDCKFPVDIKVGRFAIIETRPDEWKKGAERMEQIAQNGNGGEVYDELEGIDKTLNERGCRYGEFCDNSRVAQELKRVMKSGKNADDLRDIQREALEVIASKIARIVNGDPDYIDNWHDIIGYAKLVEIELEKEKGE